MAGFAEGRQTKNQLASMGADRADGQERGVIGCPRMFTQVSCACFPNEGEYHHRHGIPAEEHNSVVHPPRMLQIDTLICWSDAGGGVCSLLTASN